MNRLNINNLIKKNSTDIFEMIMGGKIPISVNLCPDVKEIKADEKDIEQMLLNIAIHAEHTIPQGGQLTISTGNVTLNHETSQKHDPYVSISFSYDMNESANNKNELELLFENLVHQKGTFTEVQGVVERIDGYINVHNSKGKAKTFNILIPACT